MKVARSIVCRNKCLRKMEAHELFHILGSELRLRIICLLRDRHLRVGELCKIMQVPTATVSKELMKLRELGLVSALRCGVSITYSVPREDKTDIMSALIDATYDLMSARVKADAALAKTSVPAKKTKTAAPEKIFKGNAKARNKRVPAAGTGDSVA